MTDNTPRKIGRILAIRGNPERVMPYYMSHVNDKTTVTCTAILADVTENPGYPVEKCHFCHIFLDRGRIIFHKWGLIIVSASAVNNRRCHQEENESFSEEH